MRSRTCRARNARDGRATARGTPMRRRRRGAASRDRAVRTRRGFAGRTVIVDGSAGQLRRARRRRGARGVRRAQARRGAANRAPQLLAPAAPCETLRPRPHEDEKREAEGRARAPRGVAHRPRAQVGRHDARCAGQGGARRTPEEHADARARPARLSLPGRELHPSPHHGWTAWRGGGGERGADDGSAAVEYARCAWACSCTSSCCRPPPVEARRRRAAAEPPAALRTRPSSRARVPRAPTSRGGGGRRRAARRRRRRSRRHG